MVFLIRLDFLRLHPRPGGPSPQHLFRVQQHHHPPALRQLFFSHPHVFALGFFSQHRVGYLRFRRSFWFSAKTKETRKKSQQLIAHQQTNLEHINKEHINKSTNQQLKESTLIFQLH